MTTAPKTAEEWRQISREWAAKQRHPNTLTPEQIVTLVRIFRPALLEMAKEERAARRRSRSRRGTAA